MLWLDRLDLRRELGRVSLPNRLHLPRNMYASVFFPSARGPDLYEESRSHLALPEYHR